MGKIEDKDIDLHIDRETLLQEYIPKADYVNRLKADKIDMFEELLTDIEKLDYFNGEEPVNITRELMDEVKNWEHGVKDCKTLIKEKINALKEKSRNEIQC